MKKVTRQNLQGLFKHLEPNHRVLSLEQMKEIVGGVTWEELSEHFSSSGYTLYDGKAYMWFDSYNSFNSAYSSYQSNGYIDHASPGWFYNSDGKGGWIGYYNSVFGYGPNETIPTEELCVFNTLSAITGVSVKDLFTQYKNAGYAYSPGIGGAYQDQVIKFAKEYYGGHLISNNGYSSYGGGSKSMGTLLSSYENDKKWGGHQVQIIETRYENGVTVYIYRDWSDKETPGKFGKAIAPPPGVSLNQYYGGIRMDKDEYRFLMPNTIIQF